MVCKGSSKGWGEQPGWGCDGRRTRAQFSGASVYPEGKFLALPVTGGVAGVVGKIGVVSGVLPVVLGNKLSLLLLSVARHAHNHHHLRPRQPVALTGKSASSKRRAPGHDQVRSCKSRRPAHTYIYIYIISTSIIIIRSHVRGAIHELGKPN